MAHWLSAFAARPVNARFSARMASGSTKPRSKQAGEASTRRQSRKRKQDDQIHPETEYPPSSPGKETANKRSSKKVKQNGPYENLLRPTPSECQVSAATESAESKTPLSLRSSVTTSWLSGSKGRLSNPSWRPQTRSAW